MKVIRTNPRILFQRNRIITGSGVDGITIKRKADPVDNFSENVNPLASKVGMKNIEKKQMVPNIGNKFKPPSAFDLNTDLLNGLSFKQSSKSKPKRVKLTI
jgi:hypothetical protein